MMFAQYQVDAMARVLCELRFPRSRPEEAIQEGPIHARQSHPLWWHFRDEAEKVLEAAEKIIGRKR